MNETVLFNEKGKPVGIEIDDYSVSYPLSHSFKDVNEYIHNDVHFEELQALCLGLATDLEKWKQVAEDAAVAQTKTKACEIVELALEEKPAPKAL